MSTKTSLSQKTTIFNFPEIFSNAFFLTERDKKSKELKNLSENLYEYIKKNKKVEIPELIEIFNKDIVDIQLALHSLERQGKIKNASN